MVSALGPQPLCPPLSVSVCGGETGQQERAAGMLCPQQMTVPVALGCITYQRTPLLTGKVIMHDPFAMRPFFGYNFGKYLAHWLSMAQRPAAKLPKIFHVNWFRKDKEGKFLWPGFGENSRVLEWMFNRINGEDCAQLTPIGYIPKKGALNLKGLGAVNLEELFDISKEFWEKEVEDMERYLEDQVNADLPYEITREVRALKQRVSQM